MMNNARVFRKRTQAILPILLSSLLIACGLPFVTSDESGVISRQAEAIEVGENLGQAEAVGGEEDLEQLEASALTGAPDSVYVNERFESFDLLQVPESEVSKSPEVSILDFAQDPELSTEIDLLVLPVTTLQGLKDAIANATGETTISLANDINVDSTIVIPAEKNITIDGGRILLRDATANFFDEIIRVEPRAVLTIGDTTIDGALSVSSVNSAVVVNGSLVMNEGSSIANNNVTDKAKGGGVRVQTIDPSSRAEFIMNGGSVSNCVGWGDYKYQEGLGGGVYVYNAVFRMRGGVISDNKAAYAGGGVIVLEESEFLFDGGIISGNIADRHGGGICVALPTINDQADPLGGNTVDLKSGSIVSNIARSESVTGNTGSGFGLGGGLYIQDPETAVRFTNTLITGNEADYDSDGGGGDGGGVWYCPKGHGDFTILQGSAIYGNTADTEGDDLYSESDPNNALSVILTDSMIGGAITTWYEDDTPRYGPNHRVPVAMNHPLQAQTGAKSVPTDIDKTLAENVATLHIKNNKAGVGGGIGVNSEVDFGYDAPDPQISTKARCLEAPNANSDQMAPIQKNITIVDTVSYEGLTTSSEYTLVGILMDGESGNPLEVDGKTIVGRTSFTPQQHDGVEVVEFVFDSTLLAGKDLVVFEELFLSRDMNHVIASHQDITDELQKISIVPGEDPNSSEYPNSGKDATQYSGKQTLAPTSDQLVLTGLLLSLFFFNIRLSFLHKKGAALKMEKDQPLTNSVNGCILTLTKLVNVK